MIQLKHKALGQGRVLAPRRLEELCALVKGSGQRGALLERLPVLLGVGGGGAREEAGVGAEEEGVGAVDPLSHRGPKREDRRREAT